MANFFGSRWTRFSIVHRTQQGSVQCRIHQHHLHSDAGCNTRRDRCRSSNAHPLVTAFEWFHVRLISHAERKMDVELRVCFRELMHAHEFFCRASARTNVKRQTCLVTRGAANYDTLLVKSFYPRPACARTLFAFAYAALLLGCAMCRSDGDLSMHGDKRLQKGRCRNREWAR